MALRGAMTVLPMMVLLGLCGVCFGAVYKVGDSVGWTTLGNPDYVKWASGKKFHVGDSIVFEYHKQFHNVMQVPQPDFKSCNASSPILSYTSGHDSITLKKPGDYYFLCGVPGHCQSGQKVAIKVAGGSHGPAASPGSAPSVTTPSASPLGSPSMLTSPTPSQNGGSVSRSSINLLLALSCGVIYVANFVY